MTYRHHVGVDFEYVVGDGKPYVNWHTACGMKFIDTGWENTRDAKEYFEWGPATKKKPDSVAYIPGVGQVVPQWSQKVELLETDCELCDRYLNLLVLGKAEL